MGQAIKTNDLLVQVGIRGSFGTVLSRETTGGITLWRKCIEQTRCGLQYRLEKVSWQLFSAVNKTRNISYI